MQARFLLDSLDSASFADARNLGNLAQESKLLAGCRDFRTEKFRLARFLAEKIDENLENLA